jgi:hypothetical protein
LPTNLADEHPTVRSSCQLAKYRIVSSPGDDFMRSSSQFVASVSLPILIVLIAAVLPATAQTDASFVVKKTSTKTYATAKVTADLNGDGIPDLIEPYARITPGVLFSVQLGLGNGYFAAPVSYGASINHQQGDIVLTADVNRDGKADVIFITGNYLLVFLGRGDGTLNISKAHLKSRGRLARLPVHPL